MEKVPHASDLAQMERELFKATPHDAPVGPLFHYTS